MGTDIGEIKTPSPKAMITIKGIPKSGGAAPGTTTSTPGHIDTGNMGTDIGEIKTPTPKQTVTIKGIPKGTPKTGGSGIESSITDLIG